MAVSYTTQKCDSCGGSLEYIPEKKIWRCRYCGQEILRKETYDGLFTIKNVAKQTVVDVAYRRMEQAEKNLTECEKIDTSYIGTVIARICYRLIAVVTPNVCRQEEVRSMYQRLKDDYSGLKEEDSRISEEEQTFYEFIESSDSASDVIALLILVFDTLGDDRRTEYLLPMLKVEKVYSKACNKDMLSYALKHQNMEMAKKIAGNSNNLDIHSAADVVLDKCPDVPEKADIAYSLLEKGAYNGQDRQHIREYLSGSDSCTTKATVIKACKNTGAIPDMETIIRYVLSQADEKQTNQILEGCCDGHLCDSELYELVEYALTEKAEKAGMILDAVASSGQFVVVSAKHLNLLFLDTRRSIEDRVFIWNKLKEFRFDGKAIETAATGYLCKGEDAPEQRAEILSLLLSQMKVISPASLELYLLNCTLDDDHKAEMVEKLFSLEDMRSGYFSGILGKYLKNSPDSDETTKAVENVLIQAGLTLDAGGVSDIICNSEMAATEKVELLRKMEQNGTNLRADALSIYLENCAENYQEELFVYLFGKTTGITERALSNYVLYCAHNSVQKVHNAIALSNRQTSAFGSNMCKITHLSHQITCNLMQAYLLTTEEPYETASALIQAMAAPGRITSEIQVNGNMMRMKKYVKEQRNALSPLTEQLCNDQRLFSLF